MRPVNFLRILALAGALSGYSFWAKSQRPAAPAQTGAVPAPTDGLPLVRLAEARSLWEPSSTLFVDVRSEADYQFGHITGALHLPEEEVEQRLPALRQRLERAETIIVYCKSRDCGKSLWVALRLRNAGLLQTRIYPGGWNEWVYNGQPTTGTGR
jgi:rhodanese-related sulfurtransferase